MSNRTSDVEHDSDRGAPKRGRRWLRGLVKVAVIVIIAVVGVRLWLAPTPDVFAHAPSALDAAIRQSEALGKPIVAVATSDFCAVCQHYKRGALADERVQGWIRDHAVPFFSRIEWDGADAQRLGKANGPVPATMMLVNGKVVAEFAGPMSAADLLAWLRASAAGAAEPGRASAPMD